MLHDLQEIRMEHGIAARDYKHNNFVARQIVDHTKCQLRRELTAIKSTSVGQKAVRTRKLAVTGDLEGCAQRSRHHRDAFLLVDVMRNKTQMAAASDPPNMLNMVRLMAGPTQELMGPDRATEVLAAIALAVIESDTTVVL